MGNWRGCPDIEFVYHGAWNDPELIATINGIERSFNCSIIEDPLWAMFLEDNGIEEEDTYDEHGNISPEWEERFSLFCQEEAIPYMEEVVYGGYFDDEEAEEEDEWEDEDDDDYYDDDEDEEDIDFDISEDDIFDESLNRNKSVVEGCGRRKKKSKKILNQKCSSKEGCGNKKKSKKESTIKKACTCKSKVESMVDTGLDTYDSHDLLCESCIEALRSRGERVAVAEMALDYDQAVEEDVTCAFCGEFDDLYFCPVW